MSTNQLHQSALANTTPVQHVVLHHLNNHSIHPIFVILPHPTSFTSFYLHVKHVELYSDVLLILCVHLDTVNMAEVGQQGHHVSFGVDDVANSMSWPN